MVDFNVEVRTPATNVRLYGWLQLLGDVLLYQREGYGEGQRHTGLGDAGETAETDLRERGERPEMSSDNIQRGGRKERFWRLLELEVTVCFGSKRDEAAVR